MGDESMDRGFMRLLRIKKKKQDTPRTEYIVIGVLFLAALLAFPAFRDVQILNEFVLSICAGLGLT